MAFTWETQKYSHELLHNGVTILTFCENLIIIHTYGADTRHSFQFLGRNDLEFMEYSITFRCEGLSIIHPFTCKSEYRLPVQDRSSKIKSDNLDYEMKVLELSMILRYKYDNMPSDLSNVEKSINYVSRCELRKYDNLETYELASHLIFHESEFIDNCISRKIIDDKISRFISAFVNTKPSSVKRAIN